MAHPLQELPIAGSLTVEQVTEVLTELEYRVVTKEEWLQVADVVRCARRVVRLRDNGEGKRTADDDLAYAIDQLDGEDHG